ncbi:MAG TPA: RNA polymerase-binding protein RbpA [Frankiaceae bacterium]|nr:RNA polymerase-binding protein RbpA [Frankiaceae bacterium]
MAGRDVLRGSKPGAGRGGESDRGQLAPGQRISYWCGRGHETSPWFAQDAPPPDVWDCRRCGSPAGQDPANPPGAARAVVGRTHLSHVQERRTDDEAEILLQEALARLRQAPAGSPAVDAHEKAAGPTP